jgi:hypothetical protein
MVLTRHISVLLANMNVREKYRFVDAISRGFEVAGDRKVLGAIYRL